MRQFNKEFFLIVVSCCIAAPAHGQIINSTPSKMFVRPDTLSLPVSAAEAAAHVAVREKRLQAAQSIYSTNYPADSIRNVVYSTGAKWLAQVKKNPVVGMQHDPAGRIGVRAREEEYAKGQISKRLASANISFADKAYTYMMAVQSFTNISYPERLPIAEGYLKELDALGDSAAVWQFRARLNLVDTYYQLGRTADVSRHGLRAIDLAGIMPFIDRGRMFHDGLELLYQTIDALTGTADGRNKIAMINTILSAAAVPPQTLVSLDSQFLWIGRNYQRELSNITAITSRLGVSGAPLISNYWINRPSPDSATIPVNDGKIRIVEIASPGCPPCFAAVQGIQRIHFAFPEVEAVWLTMTSGYWGNRLIEPSEEVERYKDFFVNTAKLKIPIGMWKNKKVPNEDGGISAEEGWGPNTKDYPILRTHTIYVLDGKGIIRRIFLDGSTREYEAQIAQTVKFLMREAAVAASRS